MKLFAFLAALTLSGAAFGQTICQLPATGPQQYSLAPGGGVPAASSGGFNQFLGYIPQHTWPYRGNLPSPLAFCGPAWQPNYTYVVGNMIQLSNGTVCRWLTVQAAIRVQAGPPLLPDFPGRSTSLLR